VLGQGFMRHELSHAYVQLRRFEEAAEQAEQTLAIARELGAPRSIAAALGGLGEIAAEAGDHAVAHGYYVEALEIVRELGGNPAGEGLMLGNVGTELVGLGRYAEAVEQLTRARALVDEPEHARELTFVLEQLALAHAGLGRHDEAVAPLDLALERDREFGFRQMEARALEFAAESPAGLGDRAAARDRLKQAAEVYRDLGRRANAAKARDRSATLDE
jgi:tetratricopeptide (TPR) repeat protein